jgi:hypothetical protein
MGVQGKGLGVGVPSFRLQPSGDAERRRTGCGRRSEPTGRDKVGFCVWLLESTSFWVCGLSLCAT